MTLTVSIITVSANLISLETAIIVEMCLAIVIQILVTMGHVQRALTEVMTVIAILDIADLNVEISASLACFGRVAMVDSVYQKERSVFAYAYLPTNHQIVMLLNLICVG